MESDIIVLTGDVSEGQSLRHFLGEKQFRVKLLTQVDQLQLKKPLPGLTGRVILVDLDTIPADTAFFKKIKKVYPAFDILTISSRSFHPELKDALSTHIYACLNKPIDEDELLFCITSLL